MEPSNVEVTPVNRAFLEEQGILKGMGSGLKKRKKKKKILGLIKKYKK